MTKSEGRIMKQALLAIILTGSAAFAQGLVDSGPRRIYVSASAPAACVVGEIWFKTGVTAGQNLYGCTATNTWTQQAGGSSSSAPSLVVTRTSATNLRIGADCAASTPCNVRIGATVFPFTAYSDVAITGATLTGQVRIYVSSAGILTAATTTGITVTCSGACSALTDATFFPYQSIPLFTWESSDDVGEWDVDGGTDERAEQSSTVITPGTGVSTSYDPSSGVTTLSTDSTIIGARVGVPSTSSTTCISGQWAVSATFYYSCYATNLWTRAAFATW